MDVPQLLAICLHTVTDLGALIVLFTAAAQLSA